MLPIDEQPDAAVNRYNRLLSILRSQADGAFRRGATVEQNRHEAFHRGVDAARAYASAEHAQLNEDTQNVAIDAHERALSDLGASPSTIPDRFASFIFGASLYTARVLAAQAERDVMSMAQHLHTNAMRIDLYARSGRHTLSSAAAAVMIEDAQSPAFRFVDRMGRRFKSSKHIRDTYRMHLLHTYNEVYMDTVASAGHDSIYVDHPDTQYKWHGQELLIVSGIDSHPLYYDVKEEIFHPSSRASVTIIDPGA